MTATFISGIFDQKFVFMASQDDPDGRIVTFYIFLFGKIAHIHIHLPYIFIASFGSFQIYQHKAFQDPVIENHIHVVMTITERNAILSADKREAFTQFQQKMLKIVNDMLLEVGFRQLVRFGDFQKFQYIRLAEQINRAFGYLAPFGELHDTLLILRGGEPEEKRGFLLAYQFSDIPIFQ